MMLVLGVFINCILLSMLRFSQHCVIVLDSTYVTMSISTGLYPSLDLWNGNKLYYITLQSFKLVCLMHHKTLMYDALQPMLQYTSPLHIRYMQDLRFHSIANEYRCLLGYIMPCQFVNSYGFFRAACYLHLP
jgi:hypothetical protein